MRILVTGAAGMLGTSMVPILRETGYEVFPTDIDTRDPGVKYLDIKEASQVSALSRQIRPDLIAHLAAKTDVELCEIERDDAFRTNAIGTENVARTSFQLGIPLLYMSTAGVFDGTKKEPYIESDDPNPVNYYGKTKFEGEKIVREVLEHYYIVRAGWMMGSGLAKDKKFVAKVLKKILRGERVIYGVKDKIGTPTYTVDFARNLSKLFLRGRYGTYHMVCHGRGTRYDVALEIASLLPGKQLKVIPVDSSFFSQEYFATRPDSEMLENRRLAEIDLDEMRDWKVALREYFKGSLESDLRVSMPVA